MGAESEDRVLDLDYSNNNPVENDVVNAQGPRSRPKSRSRSSSSRSSEIE